MSNRIDLTQFESKHGTELYQKIQDYIRGDDYPDEIPLRIMGLYSELIAELKRCYDRIDAMSEELACWGKVIELFDPHAKDPDLSAAISEAFGHDC